MNCELIKDSELGEVRVKVSRVAKRFIARWKADGLHITVPARTTAAEFARVMDGWRGKLLAARPADDGLRYHFGFRYQGEDWTVEIAPEPLLKPGYASTRMTRRDADGTCHFAILMAPGTDFESTGVKKLVTRLLKDLAACVARDALLPVARATARHLGLDGKVKEFKISRGLRTMGSCSATGVISLSCTLMFMPHSLRVATITHELAHLSHFDHSPAFYALWDSYLGHSHTIDTEHRRRIKIPLVA